MKKIIIYAFLICAGMFASSCISDGDPAGNEIFVLRNLSGKDLSLTVYYRGTVRKSEQIKNNAEVSWTFTGIHRSSGPFHGEDSAVIVYQDGVQINYILTACESNAEPCRGAGIDTVGNILKDGYYTLDWRKGDDEQRSFTLLPKDYNYALSRQPAKK